MKKTFVTEIGLLVMCFFMAINWILCLRNSKIV